MWISRFTKLFGGLDTSYLKKKYPRALGLELTTSCAFRCKHCPKGSAHYNRKQGIMTEEILAIVLEQIKDLEIEEISLSNDGDVSCVPNATFLRYLRKIDQELFPGVKLTVISNLAGFNDDALRSIATLKRPLKVVIDLYGARPQTVSDVTGFPHPEELEEKAQMFLSILKERRERTETYTQAFVNELNPEEQKEFTTKWTDYIPGHKVSLNKLFAYPGMDLASLGVPKIPPGTKRFPCSHPFVSWNVNYDGQVPMCCLAYGQGLVGNVKDTHLLEIWTGEPLNEVRRKHLSNDYSGMLCAACDHWYYAPRFFHPWTNISECLKERRAK